MNDNIIIIILTDFVHVSGAEILEKRGIQRPVSYFKNTQVFSIG